LTNVSTDFRYRQNEGGGVGNLAANRFECHVYGFFVLTKLWLIGCKIAKASAPDNNFLCVFFDDVDKREQEKK